MVGAPPGLIRAAAAAAIAVLAQATLAATPSWVVTGSCRDGRSHGAYELRMDGLLRVAGAFNHGKRIGSFLFWSSMGQRIALLPFDDDAMNGTVALWYSTASAKADPKPKLEAVYVGGRPVGMRSWYLEGRPRAEFRYEQEILVEARAWSVKGTPLSESEARAVAARDRLADEQFYNTLLAIVRDHLPTCEGNERKP